MVASAVTQVCKGLGASCSQRFGRSRPWSIQAPPPRPQAARQRCRAAAQEEEERWRTALGFQVNERYLEWDESAARRLIKIYVATKLDKTVEWVDERLSELGVLLPDLMVKLDRLKADLVLQLVADMPGVLSKILAFREAMPNLDLSGVLAQYPWLLLKLDVPKLDAQLAELRAALPGVAVERLIEREPMLLLTNIRAVLTELERLLGPKGDPVRMLLADPTMVLDMKAAGLPASLEIDDGIKA